MRHLTGMAMWTAIAVGFVSFGQCFQAEQVERRRGKQVYACQKIKDQDPQAQADCIKGVGR